MAGTFDKCQVKAPVEGGYITIADVDTSHIRIAARLKGIELPPEYSAAADEANARLIAAAPELLAALQRAEGALKGIYAGQGALDLWERSEVAEEIRAAIAKATK
jgi:hypothetical protein